MRNFFTTILAIFCFIAMLPQAQAADNRALKPIHNPQAEHRIALVIGNGAYTNSPLKNPVNDAKDVAAKLRGLGFEVIERNNLQTKQIGGTLREFRSKLSPGAVALVFYAGHGLQIKGINYLPSVDADINSEEDVPNQSIGMNQIMDVLEESKSRLNLVFLDACRNNPYARSFRSGDKGLARVTAPSGTLISYATKPGSVSSDGNGRNGLYTSKLLTQMDSNLQIEQSLKRVVTEVKAASQGKQEPWMEGSIEGDFCFAGCAGGASAVVNIAPAVAAPIANGLALDDIKKNQAIRGQWDKWQQAMKADYDKVAALNAAADLQNTAWDRFLASYTQNNPYSNEDETLRASAQSKKQSLQAQPKQATQVTAQTANTLRDCAECPEMVVIPAGSFDMGSPSYEGGRLDDEGPVHRVTIKKAFALGRTEITRGQFAAFVSETGYSTGDKCLTFEGGKAEERSKRSWRNPGYSQQDSHPAVCLNWNDANAYTEWLSHKTGKRFRLPTEAEWEFAARGNTTTARYWGNSLEQACTYANGMDTTGKAKVKGVTWEPLNCSDGFTYTAPVASLKPNAFGLYDMIGNVFEWTADSYHENYQGAPTDGTEWQGDGVMRVLRGGSWDVNAASLRAAYRVSDSPDVRLDVIGFRVARTLP